jgi:hypothetical protein
VTKRVLVVALVAVVIAGAAAYALRSEEVAEGPQAGPPPTLDEMAEQIGAQVMSLIYRGHVAGSSGEIMLVPKPHHFLIGEWDPSLLLSNTPILTTSHPNPWNYIVRVPIMLWGPTWIRSGMENYDEVDIAGLAPTYARILGLDDLKAEGAVLPGAVKSVEDRPKVIFTVILDGGGWNDLQQHVHAWPTIEKLGARGTTYFNATIGSTPSITGALHATFGTGTYPLQHGIPGNQMRGPDGVNTDSWQDNADPAYLRRPTVSELWDEANDNRAIVGTVSYEGWHLGMIGHGAQRAGGDKDIAVLWEKDDNEWWINEDYYTLPGYLQRTDLERLESYEAALDGRDGIVDGTWYGHTLDDLQANNVRPGTPAFARFTGDAAVDVIRNEDLGEDDVTDMIWIEMKMPDFAGHAWNMDGPEQEDVLVETDRQIARFVRELDRKVGRDNYVFAISADHGQQPIPDLEGGWRINNKELERDIEAEFGPIVEKITPVDIYVDREEVAEDDVDLAEVARFIVGYTVGDNIPDELPDDGVPEARMDDLVFVGAFPTGYLQELSEEKIESFGESEYPEGILTVERGAF